jgi:hypothetical protein
MSPDVCPGRTISGMYARLHASAVTADLIWCAAADLTVPAVQVEERLQVAAQHGPVVLEREVAAAAAASEPNPPTNAAVRTAARMRHRVSPKAERTRRTPRCYSTRETAQLMRTQMEARNARAHAGIREAMESAFFGVEGVNPVLDQIVAVVVVPCSPSPARATVLGVAAVRQALVCCVHIAAPNPA